MSSGGRAGRAALLLRVPIVRGPLRGRWWLPAGGGKVWRVLGGSYEAEEARMFERLVGPGDTVLDLGAHIGFYTLLASHRVGAVGRVFAFEPSPVNAWYLRQHARLNRCANVEVHEAAVSDRTGSTAFLSGRGSGTGRIGGHGGLRVRTVRLDDFVAEQRLRPAIVKIDVEGAEGLVLEGARELLRTARPTLFLSTHGPEAAEHCRRLLQRFDYLLRPLASPTAADFVCLPDERADQADRLRNVAWAP